MTVPEALEELRRALDGADYHESDYAAWYLSAAAAKCDDIGTLRAVYAALASLVRALIEEGRK
jgi:hypothetical protein